jgi:hypothetical protein
MMKFVIIVALISSTIAFVETPNYVGNTNVTTEITQNNMNELKALLEACPDLQVAQYCAECFLKRKKMASSGVQ